MIEEQQCIYRTVFNFNEDESKMLIRLISMVPDSIIKKEKDSDEKFEIIFKCKPFKRKDKVFMCLDFTLLSTPSHLNIFSPSDYFNGCYPSFIMRFYIRNQRINSDVFSIVGRTKLNDYKQLIKIIGNIVEYLSYRNFESERFKNPKRYKTRWEEFYNDIIREYTVGPNKDVSITFLYNIPECRVMIKDASLYFHF